MWFAVEIGFALAACAALALWLRFAGPAIAPLPEDPVVALNREHAGLAPNAADTYLKAIAAFKHPEDQTWINSGGAVDFQPPPSWAGDWLAANGPCMSLLEEASQIDQCWFDLDWPDGGPELSIVTDEHIDRLHRLRHLYKLAHASARLAADTAEWRRCARALGILDRLGRHALQQATFLDAMAGLSMLARAYWQTVYALQRSDLQQKDLVCFVAALESFRRPLPSIVPIYERERDLGRWALRYGRRQFSFRSLFVPRKRAEAREVSLYGQLLAWVRQPPHEALDAGNDVRKGRRKRLPKAPMEFHANADGVVSKVVISCWDTYARIYELYVRALCMRAGLQAIVMLHRYRAERGEWPASLDRLPQPPPPDPYSRRPLCYRTTDDGFILYSVGWNQRDDGGAHDRQFGEGGFGDVVLWPPQWPTFRQATDAVSRRTSEQ